MQTILLLTFAALANAAWSGGQGNAYAFICNWLDEDVYVSWNVNSADMRKPEARKLEPHGCWVEELEPTFSGSFSTGLRNNTECPAVGYKRDRDTKTEISNIPEKLALAFDVDLEKGASVPIVVRMPSADGNTTVRAGCSVDKLAACPPEMQIWEDDKLVNCVRNDDSPASLDFFRHGCPDIYVQPDDHQAMKTGEGPVAYVDIGTPLWQKDNADLVDFPR